MTNGILTALAVSIAVGGIGLSTSAIAKPRGGNMPTFEQFDTNGDGVITQAEIEGIGAAKFAESDTNGDGYLDADELKAQMAERGEGRRGGQRGKGGQHEGKEDCDHEDKGDQEREGNPELMQSQHAERQDLAIKHMLERADTDGNGKLSIDEVRAPKFKRIFERMDADDNGEITKAEWDDAVGERGRRGHGRN